MGEELEKLKSINNYKDLQNHFRIKDHYVDKKITREELSEKEIESLDKDGSGTVEIWEIMETVNRLQRKLIFTQTDIETNKLAYEYFEDSRIKDLAEKYRTDATFEALYSCIKAGFAKVEIVDFLEGIAEVAENKSNTFSAYRALPAMIEAKLKKEEIVDLLKTVAEVAKNNTSLAYEALPVMIEAKLDKKEIVDLLKTVTEAAGLDTYHAYFALPTAIESFQREPKLNEEEIVNILKTVTQLVKKDIPWAYEVLIPAAVNAELNEKIVDLLKSINQAAGENSNLTYKSLPAAIEVLKKAKLDKEEIVGLLETIAKVVGKDTHWIYKALPKLTIGFTKADFNYKNPHSRISNLIFITSYGKGRLRNFYELIVLLKIDLEKCTNKEDFAKEFALKLNTFFKNQKEEEELRWISQVSAVIINTIHDNDSVDDFIRKTICQNLSTQAKYYLISLGGADLYTSTFLRIYDNLVKQENFLDEIDKIDPEGKLMTGFILTLASFDRFTDIFIKNPAFFFEKIKKLIEDKENVLKNASLLIKTFEEILTNGKFKNYKQKTEELLLELYYKFNVDNHLEGRGALGYIIKLCKEKFSPENKEEVEKICQTLPEILEPKVPKKWLEDNGITAKLYFYEDEQAHFELIQTMYIKRGFKKQIKDKKTVILTKELNGIKLKVIATLDNSDVDQSLKDSQIDIVGHRGHSYHLDKTFRSCFGCKNQKKLLYLGSCGSFRSIPHLRKYYAGNYFVADEDMGRGEGNNNILYYMMEAIAKGYKDWNKIREYINGHIELEERGLVFPNDKSLLVFDFVEHLR